MPVTVSDITNAVAVATGEGDTCALLSDGGVECWGLNLYGELGLVPGDSVPVPVPLPGF